MRTHLILLALAAGLHAAPTTHGHHSHRSLHSSKYAVARLADDPPGLAITQGKAVLSRRGEAEAADDAPLNDIRRPGMHAIASDKVLVDDAMLAM